jgi:hypothetical protein
MASRGTNPFAVPVISAAIGRLGSLDHTLGTRRNKVMSASYCDREPFNDETEGLG